MSASQQSMKRRKILNPLLSHLKRGMIPSKRFTKHVQNPAICIQRTYRRRQKSKKQSECLHHKHIARSLLSSTHEFNNYFALKLCSKALILEVNNHLPKSKAPCHQSRTQNSNPAFVEHQIHFSPFANA